MHSTMAKLSRREWTALAGTLVGGVELAAGNATAQQSAAAGRDHLAEQRESIRQDIAELRKIELDYAEEPIFALVVR